MLNRFVSIVFRCRWLRRIFRLMKQRSCFVWWEKIFAMLDLERPDVVSLKCNPDYALQLREEHPEISGAWHMNKKILESGESFGAFGR